MPAISNPTIIVIATIMLFDIRSEIMTEAYRHQFNGQPSTTMPLAVGHCANGQCSPSVPHQVKPFPSMPTEKYNSTPMKATPASSAAERM